MESLCNQFLQVRPSAHQTGPWAADDVASVLCRTRNRPVRRFGVFRQVGLVDLLLWQGGETGYDESPCQSLSTAHTRELHRASLCSGRLAGSQKAILSTNGAEALFRMLPAEQDCELGRTVR